jgi:hypothetical protein
MEIQVVSRVDAGIIASKSGWLGLDLIWPFAYGCSQLLLNGKIGGAFASPSRGPSKKLCRKSSRKKRSINGDADFLLAARWGWDVGELCVTYTFQPQYLLELQEVSTGTVRHRPFFCFLELNSIFIPTSFLHSCYDIDFYLNITCAPSGRESV